MSSYHRTTIVGHLGKDPEQRFMTNGDAVCNFSVAVTESWKNKQSGEKQEQTTWYRVTAFQKLAEICSQFLVKGSQVLIDGKMQCRDYTDKDGNKRQSWELKADSMQMLGSKGPSQDNQDSEPQRQQQKPAQERNAQGATRNSFDDIEDDIPFACHGHGKTWRVI